MRSSGCAAGGGGGGNFDLASVVLSAPGVKDGDDMIDGSAMNEKKGVAIWYLPCLIWLLFP